MEQAGNEGFQQVQTKKRNRSSRSLKPRPTISKPLSNRYDALNSDQKNDLQADSEHEEESYDQGSLDN